MGSSRPAATSEEAAARLATLSESLWVMAAVGVGLQRGMLGEEPLPGDDPVVDVLAAVGLVVDGDDGRALAPGLRALVAAIGAEPLAHDVVANFRQVARVLGLGRQGDRGDGGNGATWAGEGDDTLLAQGRASTGLARPLAGYVIPQLAGLAERLGRPGGRFLDVGVGVAGLATAMCDLFPDLSVVGLEVMPRAIDLARSEVAARGVAERIELRLLDVASLADVESYDLAWLPAPFVGRRTLREALPRLLRALRPGGWLLVAMGRLEGDPVSASVTVWRTTLRGGTVMPPAQAVAELADAGFADVASLSTPPTAPVIVAARRG